MVSEVMAGVTALGSQGEITTWPQGNEGENITTTVNKTGYLPLGDKRIRGKASLFFLPSYQVVPLTSETGPTP